VGLEVYPPVFLFLFFLVGFLFVFRAGDACGSFMSATHAPDTRLHITYGDIIGHGAYGVVKKAQAKGQEVAVKFVKPKKEPGVPHDAIREIGILRELNHPHIVNLLEVLIDSKKQKIAMVLELSNFDLQGILTRHREHEKVLAGQYKARAFLPLPMIKMIMYQLLDATDYLHSQWVMHRDIKPANILVTGEGCVKLADFGMARVFLAPPRPLVDDRTVVTSYYRAPELLFGSRHYTPAIDVWALGAVFGELLLGNYMFPGSGDEKADEKTGIVVAKSQILKVFDRLGCPDVRSWPSVVEMPKWDLVLSWEEVQHPKISPVQAVAALSSQIIDRLTQSGNGRNSAAECKSAVDSMLQMLAFDPAKRLTCKEGKESAFFQGTPSGNVLEKFGHQWQSFYLPCKKKKCVCKECQKKELKHSRQAILKAK
jgi:cyclin-dependent kinase 8/11